MSRIFESGQATPHSLWSLRSSGLLKENDIGIYTWVMHQAPETVFSHVFTRPGARGSDAGTIRRIEVQTMLATRARLSSLTSQLFGILMQPPGVAPCAWVATAAFSHLSAGADSLEEDPSTLHKW